MMIKKIKTPKDPLDVYTSLSKNHEYAFLLESVSGPDKLSEYSFIGYDPLAIFSAENNLCTINDKIRGDIFEIETSAPLDILEKILFYNVDSKYGFRFIGGAVGYVSYESIKYWEKIKLYEKKKIDFPDMEFAIYNKGIIVDHRMNEAYFFGPFADEDEICFKNESSSHSDSINLLCANSSISKDEFEEMVHKAKEYIIEGDIFQVVLTKKYNVEYQG
ncbi:MAG: hypothetical protein QW413_05515, partial [Nitrososphaerota archaeon]